MLWLIPVDTHAKRIDPCPPPDRRSARARAHHHQRGILPAYRHPDRSAKRGVEGPVMDPLMHEKVPPLRLATLGFGRDDGAGNDNQAARLDTRRGVHASCGRVGVPNIGITSGNCGNPRRPVRRGAAKANEMASLLDFPGRACAMVAAEGPDIPRTSGNCGKSSTTSPAEIAENAEMGFRRPVTPLRCRRSSRLPPPGTKLWPPAEVPGAFRIAGAMRHT